MAYKLNVDRADEVGQALEQGERNYWTPADGRNEIRIMPPCSQAMAEDGKYFFETGFHYRVGPDDKVLPCPRLAKIREDCYLCSMANRLKKSTDEEDQAEAKELWPKRKYLMSVVDLTHPERGVQTWAAGIKAMRGVHFYVRDREYGDITDPEEGYDLIVEKSGANLNTEYLVRAKKRASVFPTKELIQANPLLADILEELPNLSSFLEYPTNSEMKDAYDGTSGREERRRDDEEEEKPKRLSSRARDDEEEEEEEDEKPTRSSSDRSGSGSRSRGRDEAPRGKGPRFPDEEEADEEEKKEDGKSARRTDSEPASRRVSKALRSRSRER